MNWAVCPLNRLPFFLSSLPQISPFTLFTFGEQRCAALPIFNRTANIAPFHFRLHFRNRFLLSALSLSFFLFPISVPFHTARRRPLPTASPLSAWAQFLRLRLSHCQNGGKAQSVTIPQALRLRTKCLLIFFCLVFLSSATISSISAEPTDAMQELCRFKAFKAHMMQERVFFHRSTRCTLMLKSFLEMLKV